MGIGSIPPSFSSASSSSSSSHPSITPTISTILKDLNVTPRSVQTLRGNHISNPQLNSALMLPVTPEISDILRKLEINAGSSDIAILLNSEKKEAIKKKLNKICQSTIKGSDAEQILASLDIDLESAEIFTCNGGILILDEGFKSISTDD